MTRYRLRSSAFAPYRVTTLERSDGGPWWAVAVSTDASAVRALVPGGTLWVEEGSSRAGEQP